MRRVIASHSMVMGKARSDFHPDAAVDPFQ